MRKPKKQIRRNKTTLQVDVIVILKNHNTPDGNTSDDEDEDG